MSPIRTNALRTTVYRHARRIGAAAMLLALATVLWNANTAQAMPAETATEPDNVTRVVREGEYEEQASPGYALEPFADVRDEAGLTLVGGPDAAGYIFSDSDEPDGPPVNFENIAGSGTHLGALTSVSAAALPFTFQFYDQDYTSIEVSPNGFFSFLAGTPIGYGGQPIPTAGAPNAIVAALWANWAPSGAGGSVRPNVYYHTLGVAPNRRFIVQWDGDAGYATGPGGCSWGIGDQTDTRVQVKLFETSNDIEVQYGVLDRPICRSYGSTGGIENETGTIGLQYLYVPVGAPLSPVWPDSPHAVLYERTEADVSITIDSPQCSPYGPNVADDGALLDGALLDGVMQPSGVAIAGEEIIYTVGVYNGGPDPAIDATATVTLPVGVEYLADTDSCVSDNGVPEVLTCSLGDIEPYAYVGFEIKVFIDAGLVRLDADGTMVITAQASVDAANPDPALENNVDDSNCFVQDLADLSVMKLSKPDDLALAGEPFHYTIYVDNTGPSWARGVYILDDMIADDTFVVDQVIDDPIRNDVCSVVDATAPQTGQIIRCELREPLEPFGGGQGTGRWRIQVEAHTAVGDEPRDIDNTVRVYTDAMSVPNVIDYENGTPDPDESNNVAVDAISILDTADLELTKQADLDVVTAGELLRYTIRVTNTGHALGGSEATNVRIYDNLPAEVELVTVTVSDGDCVAGTPGDPLDPTMCVIDNMAVGESHTMTVFVRVKPDVAVNPVLPCDQPAPYCRGRIFNDAWVTSDAFDPELDNNLTSESTDVKFVADLQVFKSDTPDVVVAGEMLSYEIIVNNAGPSTARDVILVDVLPDAVEFVSATLVDGSTAFVCDVTAGNHLLCHLGDIEPGAPPLGMRNILVNVRVRPDTPAGTITNTAQAFTFQTYDPDMANSVADEDTLIRNAAELSITKTAVSSSVTPPGVDREGTVTAVGGGTLTYEIVVTNHGPSTAYNVVVTDPLTGWDLDISYLYSTSAVCTPGTPGVTPVTCDLGELDPGESRTFQLIVLVHEGGGSLGRTTITNTATVTWELAEGAPGGQAQDTEVVPVSFLSDMRITKFGKPDGEVRAGERLTYTIIVDNLGPSFAPSVAITDEIRSDGIFSIVGMDPDVGLLYDHNVQCSIDAPSSDAPINPVVTNQPVGQPYVPGAEPIVPNIDQRATISCVMNLEGTAEMPVFGPPSAGANTGTGEGRLYIELVLEAEEGVDINNCASVSTAATDPDFSNNQTCTMHEVTEVADLQVEKQAEGEVGPIDCEGTLVLLEDRVTPGGKIKYTMTVVNNGPSTAENVTLMDRLPPGIVVTNYSVTDPSGAEIGDCTTGTAGSALDKLTCGLDSLATGTAGTAIVTVEADVDPSVPDGTILENDVFVFSDQFDDDNSDNFDSNLTIAQAVADLEISKTDNPDPVLAGELLSYRIRVLNKGLSDALNVVVADWLPPEVEFVSADEAISSPVAAVCGYDPIDHVVTCNLGVVPAGVTAVIDVYVRVKPDAVPSGMATVLLQNAATVSSSTFDPCIENNDVIEDTQVDRQSDVINAKIDDPDPVVAGTEVKYTISFGNEGLSTATNVTVVDVLPAGLTYLRCEPAHPADRVTCTDLGGGLIAVNSIVVGGVEVWNDTFGTPLNDLDPGESYWFQIVAFVDEGYVLDGLGDTGPGQECRELALASDWPHFAHDRVTVSSLDSAFDIDECTKVVAEADLEIEKTDIFGDFATCDPVEPGGEVTYVITVRNHGPSDAGWVVLEDWLPAGFVIVDPAEVDIEIVGDEGEVLEVRDDGYVRIALGAFGEGDFGRMDDGDEVVVIIRTRMRLDGPCGDTFTNRASVMTYRNDDLWPPVPGFSSSRTPTPDPDLSNNVAFEDTLVECPAVEVVKTVSFDGTCPGRDLPSVWNQTGQPVTFCFEVTNTGTTYLDEIYLEDVLETRTMGAVTIYTDTIRFGADPRMPLAPGETVKRQVTIPHLLMDGHQECGKVTDTVTVTANPVNSGRTDLECLSDVTASDTALIEVPCAGVDWRIQLPILGGSECDTWIQVQNVGDADTKAMIVYWGEAGFCPPQAAGPLKNECSGLLSPGSAWSFAVGQIPGGAESAVVYSLSVDLIEHDRGTFVPFADIVCHEIFYGVIGSHFDWFLFDNAYRQGGVYDGMDFGMHQGEPLAATVNRACADPVDANLVVNAAYTGISSDMEGARDPRYGAYMYYAPLIFAEQQGLNSILNIQNSGDECTSLEIWFKSQDNCLRSVLGDVLTLSPGETVKYDPNTVVGPGWIGSAWIRASQPLGIVVDTFGSNHFTSYVGTAADVWDLDYSYGNQVNFAPLTYSEYQGWDTAIQVQNLSAVTAAKVKVYFLDRGGGVITTLVDWICPRGTQTFFLPLVDSLPGNWVGSVRVESQEWLTPGGPNIAPPMIASVVLLEKWADPQRTVRREAVAYNAQTECLLYDWQVGAGRGGTASGSAVFAVPLVAREYNGITTELAITNLVPKPGFTDFAIFIYDQNGLLDYVCQKLTEKQVEYIDLSTWGAINPRFMGSVVVSAVFWEHDVFDKRGGFERNVVGLGGVAVERVGGTLGQPDVPGDESKAFEAFPVYDHFGTSETPNCPGLPGR